MKSFLTKHNIQDKKIAIGVSGGADSLALALWAAENAENCGVRIVALTVDHKLRPESGREAAYVAEIMKKNNIEHHILCWGGKKPSTGIEEAAREARYNLLRDWCKKNGIKSVMVAHHQLDQAETFFMRLQRGSGLDGLCGMSSVSNYGDLQILRPFLDKNPNELKKYLSEKNIKWVEDPSNQNEDFLRVKIRKFMPVIQEKLGIDIAKITKTMEILSRSKAYIDIQTQKFWRNHCKVIADSAVVVSLRTIESIHEEILYHFMLEALQNIGGKHYQPRADDILRLNKRICSGNFTGATLAGCEIFVQYDKLFIIPETKNLSMPKKKQWEDFAKKHEEFKKKRIPGKLKRILVNFYGEGL